MRALPIGLAALALAACGRERGAPVAGGPLAGWADSEVSGGAAWVLPRDPAFLEALVRPLAIGSEVGRGFRLVALTLRAERADLVLSDGRRSLTLQLFHRDVAGGTWVTPSFQVRAATAGLRWDEAIAAAEPLVAVLQKNDDGHAWREVRRARP